MHREKEKKKNTDLDGAHKLGKGLVSGTGGLKRWTHGGVGGTKLVVDVKLVAEVEEALGDRDQLAVGQVPLPLRNHVKQLCQGRGGFHRNMRGQKKDGAVTTQAKLAKQTATRSTAAAANLDVKKVEILNVAKDLPHRLGIDETKTLEWNEDILPTKRGVGAGGREG